MTDSRHYKAFISYSHTDEAWARWLQRALEGYHLPKSLRQSHHELPARLYPIFRDRDELASAHDLSDSIRQAMDDSDALIVICSPAARASRWVNEEIRRFRIGECGQRIFCLMVAGSPDPDATDCAFPDALLRDIDGNIRHEPLAADASPSGDGKRNAMLKIAAGLLNVGVDELKRRDAQRQARFWSGVAFGSLFIATLTIGLALYALNAKRESEIRRNQAENLIGFMLGDLRKNLEPIGKLELLDSVGDQAMTYFAAIGENGTEKEMLERAKALKQIGDVRFNQGELEPALKAFRQALAQTKALHESNPANNDYLFELGQAEFWVGYVAWERGELNQAYASMQRYMECSEILSRREPRNVDYLLELSYAHSNLGSVSKERGDFEKALKEFIASATIAGQLMRSDPKNTELAMNLADALSWIGSTQLELGNLRQGRIELEKAAMVMRPFHQQGGDKRASAYYARLLTLHAEAEINAGALPEARKSLDESQRVHTQLLETDPSNSLWRISMVKSESTSLNLSSSIQSQHDDLANLVRIENKITQLAAKEPKNNDILVFRSRLQSAHIILLIKSGDTTAALTYAERTWHDWQKAIKDKPMTPDLMYSEALLAEATGTARAATGDYAGAHRLWNALAEKLDSRHSRNLSLLAVRRLLAIDLKQPSTADRIETALQAASFHDPRLDPAYTLSGAFR